MVCSICVIVQGLPQLWNTYLLMGVQNCIMVVLFNEAVFCVFDLNLFSSIASMVVVLLKKTEKMQNTSYRELITTMCINIEIPSSK